jgi:hypothetical protein
MSESLKKVEAYTNAGDCIGTGIIAVLVISMVTSAFAKI